MTAECLFLIVSVNVGITLCNYLYQAQQDNIVAFSINLCKYMHHAQASRSRFFLCHHGHNKNGCLLMKAGICRCSTLIIGRHR